MPQIFTHVPFLYYWLGQTVSLLGDEIFVVAVIWEAMSLTRSTVAQGTFFALLAIPRLALLLVGGVISDRWNRVHIMIAADTCRAVLITALAIISLSGHIQLWHLYGFAVAFSIIDAFFWPAAKALLPTLVPPSLLGRANGLVNLSAQMNVVLGSMIGGLLVGAVGSGAGFAVDAVTFLVSVASLVLVLLYLPAGAVTHSGQRQEFWRSLTEGLRYAFAQPYLRAMLLCGSVVNLALIGPSGLALPHLMRDAGLGPDQFGFLRAALGAGSILGAILLSFFPPARRRGRMVFAAVALAGLAWGSIIAIPGLAGMAVTLAVFGVCFAVMATVGATLLQTVTEPAMLGRVGSIWTFSGLGLEPVSYLLTGALLNVMPAAPLFGISGLMMLLAGAAAGLSRGARQTE